MFRYERLSENQGGAGGFSRGVKLAAESGFDYLWLMDDDCFPEKTALESLMSAANDLNGRFGWLSGVCLWTDHSICRMNVQRKTPFQDLHDFSREKTEAQMASFVSLLVPAASVIRYGLPIQEFFIWGDDWEYTRRISRNEKCYVIGNSRVIHAMKNNTVVSIAEDEQERLPRYTYAYRNDVYIYRREGLKGWVWLLAKNIWHSMKTLRMHHPERLKIIWNGFWEGIQFHPVSEMICEEGTRNCG